MKKYVHFKYIFYKITVYLYLKKSNVDFSSLGDNRFQTNKHTQFICIYYQLLPKLLNFILLYKVAVSYENYYCFITIKENAVNVYVN